jgi:spectinomycin phosphotransferase
MLEKPDLPDHLIISRLQAEFNLEVSSLTFLPLGADVNTAVYRAITLDKSRYFLKLRKGDPDEIIVTLPQYLKSHGIQAVIAPLETTTHQRWAGIESYRLILYPFIQGRNAYEVPLSRKQWLDFGAALRAIHAAQLPPELASRIPRETFSSYWRDWVRYFQHQVEVSAYTEPVAAKFAAFMHEHRDEITRLVARADQLSASLQSRSFELVLCHSDIHAGNLLLTPSGRLYIVDWDNPIFAPKERDLMLVGGSSTWLNPRQAARFYQGYGLSAVDPVALAYYRCERIIWDFAAYCEQLLLSAEGGGDREQSYRYFTSSFLPGHEIELALATGS